MNIDQAVENFLTHQLASGRSPHTIGAHQRDLRLLINCLSAEVPITSITPSDLDRFFLDRSVTHQSNDTPKTVTSINRTRSTIKSFFNWAAVSGDITRNPATAIQTRRDTQKPPIYLTSDEVRTLLKTIRAQKGWQAARDVVIVTLFIHTGIRLSELENLDVTDVNLLEKRLTIQAKGGQIETRFLNTKARAALHGFLKDRRKVLTDSPALFLSQRLERITSRQVQRRLDEWAIKAGITKQVHPHTLRHTFATTLYARTSNILAVQQALGHASVITTQIYAHLFDDALESALETL
jgi:integrase/recombinase XerC